MSQENVEIVRMSQVIKGIYESFNDGDFERLMELCDPGIEFHLSDVWFGVPRTYHGYQGVLNFARDIAEVFEGFNVQIESLHVGDQEVVAITRSGGTGRGSRAPVNARFGHLWRFKGDRPAFLKEFKRPEDAFGEAVGLSEQDAHADS